MAQPTTTQSPCNEDNILLAISDLKRRQIGSVRQAAATYNVPSSTLRNRLAGRPARRDCQPNSKKVTPLEEEAIVTHILDLESKGYPLSLDDVRRMANTLLAERDAGTVGKAWPYNFVKRTKSLATRFSRQHNRKRAPCEDPEVIGGWFKLVQRTQATHGILAEDTYNFDNVAFMMGKISPHMVFTGTKKHGRASNPEWATVIQGINAAGWAIPPFIILPAKNSLSASHEKDLPHGWEVAVSDDGWTTDDLEVAWLRHFIKHTDSRTVGARRLLVLDGREGHRSARFEELCKENNIYTLCIPSHSLHLLQPFDVGCSIPLKRAYTYELERLVRSHVRHVTELEFLPAFKAVFYQVFTETNICAGFRGAGLVPFNPDAVLSKLDVAVRTPSPPASPEPTWVSKTPTNERELEAEASLLRGLIQESHGSSPSIMEPLERLIKGAMQIMHKYVLLKERVAALEKINEDLTKREGRGRERIQKRGTFKVVKGARKTAQKAATRYVVGERRQGAAQSGVNRQAVGRCSRCKKPGHNSRTCKKDTVDIS
jgi:hypothetical protein